MKVQSSVRLICKDCFFVRRGKKLLLRYVSPLFIKHSPSVNNLPLLLTWSNLIECIDAIQTPDTREDRASQLIWQDHALTIATCAQGPIITIMIIMLMRRLMFTKNTNKRKLSNKLRKFSLNLSPFLAKRWHQSVHWAPCSAPLLCLARNNERIIDIWSLQSAW